VQRAETSPRRLSPCSTFDLRIERRDVRQRRIWDDDVGQVQLRLDRSIRARISRQWHFLSLGAGLAPQMLSGTGLVKHASIRVELALQDRQLFVGGFGIGQRFDAQVLFHIEALPERLLVVQGR
jgi:hypothetical protein